MIYKTSFYFHYVAVSNKSSEREEKGMPEYERKRGRMEFIKDWLFQSQMVDMGSFGGRLG